MIADVFALWSPVAVATVVLAGIAYGLVLRRLSPAITVYGASLLTLTLGAFWHLPLAVQRLADPDHAIVMSGLRTFGVMLLFLLFTAGMASALAVIRRR